MIDCPRCAATRPVYTLAHHPIVLRRRLAVARLLDEDSPHRDWILSVILVVAGLLAAAVVQ